MRWVLRWASALRHGVFLVWLIYQWIQRACITLLMNTLKDLLEWGVHRTWTLVWLWRANLLCNSAATSRSYNLFRNCLLSSICTKDSGLRVLRLHISSLVLRLRSLVFWSQVILFQDLLHLLRVDLHKNEVSIWIATDEVCLDGHSRWWFTHLMLKLVQSVAVSTATVVCVELLLFCSVLLRVHHLLLHLEELLLWLLLVIWRKEHGWVRKVMRDRRYCMLWSVPTKARRTSICEWARKLWQWVREIVGTFASWWGLVIQVMHHHVIIVLVISDSGIRSLVNSVSSAWTILHKMKTHHRWWNRTH